MNHSLSALRPQEGAQSCNFTLFVGTQWFSALLTLRLRWPVTNLTNLVPGSSTFTGKFYWFAIEAPIVLQFINQITELCLTENYKKLKFFWKEIKVLLPCCKPYEE